MYCLFACQVIVFCDCQMTMCKKIPYSFKQTYRVLQLYFIHICYLVPLVLNNWPHRWRRNTWSHTLGLIVSPLMSLQLVSTLTLRGCLFTSGSRTWVISFRLMYLGCIQAFVPKLLNSLRLSYQGC